jgi:hypothetical protein
VKDHVNHYHPGAKVRSHEIDEGKEYIDVTCEKGHETQITPSSIIAGAWCGECFKEHHLWGETKCREAVERLLGAPFGTDRPEWMPRPRGGRPLELDMYNKKLKIAFEYNGIQHYEYHERFHKGDPREFQRQVEYDALKARECEKRGITLIPIPYSVPPHKFEEYIRKELANRGIDVDAIRQKQREWKENGE